MATVEDLRLRQKAQREFIEEFGEDARSVLPLLGYMIETGDMPGGPGVGGQLED